MAGYSRGTVGRNARFAAEDCVVDPSCRPAMGDRGSPTWRWESLCTGGFGAGLKSLIRGGRLLRMIRPTDTNCSRALRVRPCGSLESGGARHPGGRGERLNRTSPHECLVPRNSKSNDAQCLAPKSRWSAAFEGKCPPAKERKDVEPLASRMRFSITESPNIEQFVSESPSSIGVCIGPPRYYPCSRRAEAPS